MSSGTNTTNPTGNGGSASGSNQNPHSTTTTTKTANTANSGQLRLTDEEVKQLTDSANTAKKRRGLRTSKS